MARQFGAVGQLEYKKLKYHQQFFFLRCRNAIFSGMEIIDCPTVRDR